MAVTVLTGRTQAAAINYNYTTSGSTDWSSVPNSTYFYDLVDKLPHYKNPSGTVLEIFSSSSDGGVSIDPYYNVGTASTVTWNVSGTSTNYRVTLTGTTTINLTNVRDGDYGTIIVKQDNVGSRTASFGTVNGSSSTHKVVNGGGGSPVLTSNSNAIDILSFTYDNTDSIMYWTVGNDYT